MIVSKNKKQFIATASIFFLFELFAFFWILVYNRYSVLYYQEQIQLFRFDSLYFLSCISHPGGLSEYLGAFFTQFYVYPVVGTVIIIFTLLCVFLFFFSICRQCGDITKLFVVPFIPSILLLISFVNIEFNISYAIGLLLLLAVFRCYINIQPTVFRYISGIVLYPVTYIAAGGNALLLFIMILIFEIFEDKYKFKLLYLLILAVWAVVIPYLAMTFLWVIPLQEVYFALTPSNLTLPSVANLILWMSLPLLYVSWRLISIKSNGWKIGLYKSLVVNCVLAIFFIVYGCYSVREQSVELFNHITKEIQEENWDKALTLSKSYPSSNPIVCYLTNIALAESGHMPYRMFEYVQVGTNGLFLDWLWGSTHVSWYFGESYYRLGIIPEAEQCAFKAMVASRNKPNAQTLKRLVYTNMIRRDSLTVCKYLNLFENSLTYRKWAKQQRVNLSLAMRDVDYSIPDTPQPYWCDDFFIDYQSPDKTLQKLLQVNPKHRLAFEYLMSFYMLQKDIEQVKKCMDTYYESFDYPTVPTHYEEALIVCRNVLKDNSVFEKYPINKVTHERFHNYAKAFEAAQFSNRNLEQIKKQFGNTFWYYMHFVENSPIQQKDGKSLF